MSRFLLADAYFKSSVGEGYNKLKLYGARREKDDLGAICNDCGESPEFCTCMGEMPVPAVDIYQFTEN